MMIKKKAKPIEQGPPAFDEHVCSGDVIRCEHEGFTIAVTFEYDQDADLSYYGEFSDEHDDNAIDHHATGTWLERSYRGPRYFHSAYYKDALDYYLRHEKASPEEAKALADKQAMSNYERMVDYHQGGWSMLGMIVTVYLNGVELGDSSIWGVESDTGTSGFLELYEERLDEALVEARKKLDTLCETAKKLPKAVK